MQTKNSVRLFKQALTLMPGGVNSPVRAFKAVGGQPVFIAKAKGCKLYDVDGNAYIDYVLSWGPMIVGHSHPQVVLALKKAADKGTSYGAPHALEIELAQLVMKAYPSIKKIRMVSSGTEATMAAIRVARGYTGRDKIIKFEGCYHGHADGLLVRAGSGAMTFGVPDSPGVPKSYAKDTITVPFNNIKAVKTALEKNKGKVACVIIEPVVGNMGCILPKDGFLQELRDLTQRHDVVLIFDEVMTGFRLGLGGAQRYYKVTPDLTCLGKVIGGGLPVGAYGGKAEIMSKVSPEGPIYQAGTLSGNPMAMTAGIETLKLIMQKGFYEDLDRKMSRLAEGLVDASNKAGLKIRFYKVGSMFCTYFTDTDVIDYKTAKTADTAKFAKFFHSMLSQGIYIAPSQFEAGFISSAHLDKDIDKTIKSAFVSFKKL